MLNSTESLWPQGTEGITRASDNDLPPKEKKCPKRGVPPPYRTIGLVHGCSVVKTKLRDANERPLVATYTTAMKLRRTIRSEDEYFQICFKNIVSHAKQTGC